MHRPSPYLLLVLTTLFWAGNFVLGRAVQGVIPPIALSFWRWAVALALALPFAWPHLRRQWPVVRAHWPALLGLGVLGVTNYNTFAYIGLQTTTATNASLLVSVTPVLILALAVPVLGQRVGAGQAAGILLSLIGVAVIVVRGDPMALAGIGLNAGDAWVLGAVLSWALYSVCLRWAPRGLHPLAFLAVLVAAGLLPLGPLYAWELATRGGFEPGAVSLGAIAYVGLFPSVLAYLFWNRAVAELGAGRTGQFMHLVPAFGVLLSVLLLGERLQPFHLAGVGLIGLGIWLAGRNSNHGP